MVRGLWTVVNGEPFMENPALGILNSGKSKRKRGGRKMARRSSRAHMAWVRSFRKKGRKHHRRARRNPWTIGGAALNRRRHHRRYRRNPDAGSMSVAGFKLPALQSVLYAGGGLVGTPMLEGFLGRFLPASLTGNQIGKYAVKIGAVLGLTWIAKTVLGRDAAKMVGVGGGAYVLLGALREFAPGILPVGMGAYTSGMAAYSGMQGLGAPNWGARLSNQTQAAPMGGSNVVPARFRRFN